MPGVIEVEGLTKRCGSHVAVDGISFTVAEGEIFGLLGPNGAGKTTSVECIEGLRHADGGHISVLGLDPRTQTAELRHRMGAQLQESSLPDRIKVWEALDLFCTVEDSDTDCGMLLEQWGLSDKRGASFGSLSGGQRQRLLVALALVNDPDVVFLDEMTTGLDPASRHVAWDLIRAVAERGTTIVLVTHFMDEAERLCARVGIMNEGRIAALDTPDGLIREHAPDVRVTFRSDTSELAWIERLPCVTRIQREGPRVVVEGVDPVLALVAAGLVERGETPGRAPRETAVARRRVPEADREGGGGLMRAFRKMTWTELKLFVREPITLVFTLAFPVLTVVVLGKAFGNSPQEDTEDVFRGMGAMDYYLPAYVALAIPALGLISILVHLSGYRDKGILRRFRASGISARALLGAQVGVMVVISAVGPYCS